MATWNIVETFLLFNELFWISIFIFIILITFQSVSTVVYYIQLHSFSST